MTDKEKDILKILKDVIPTLDEFQKQRLIGFSEGLAVKSKMST